MSIPLLPVVALTLLSLAIADATAQSVTTHSCAGVTEPSRRLACYDAAFPPAAGALTGPVDLEAEREKARRDFGLSRVQMRDREPEHIREAFPDRIEAVVTSVIQRATGERVLTLDSGQVWLLTELTSKGRLAKGDRVVIREAAMGTYMLLTPKRIPLRARRLN